MHLVLWGPANADHPLGAAGIPKRPVGVEVSRRQSAVPAAARSMAILLNRRRGLPGGSDPPARKNGFSKSSTCARRRRNPSWKNLLPPQRSSPHWKKPRHSPSLPSRRITASPPLSGWSPTWQELHTASATSASPRSRTPCFSPAGTCRSRRPGRLCAKNSCETALSCHVDRKRAVANRDRAGGPQKGMMGMATSLTNLFNFGRPLPPPFDKLG